ncbi:hypothetical protein QL285_095556 [Trifolium repens]|nr:hypothetical protein QL285_095556 [Trifolium repens]
MERYHSITLKKAPNSAGYFEVECQLWNNRHLYILQGEPVVADEPVFPADYLDHYRRDYNPYLSGDYFLNDPRPQPYPQTHDTGAQSSRHDTQSSSHGAQSSRHGAQSSRRGAQSSRRGAQPSRHGAQSSSHGHNQPSHNQPSPLHYSEQPHPHTPLPELSLYTNPDQPSYTPQQQDIYIPQPPPFTQSQTFNESNFFTPFSQTRNFFNFDSPGTQRFNEHYAHIQDTTPYQPTQPQPTQEISQDMFNTLINSDWATYGRVLTDGLGGQGSSSAAVQYNQPTRVHNFMDLEVNRSQQEEENQQQYGLGHRQGYPPPCGTGSHRFRPGDDGNQRH